MYLHEYQAKQLFITYGLLVPKGYICKNLFDINEAILKIGNSPWVIKCQIHGGGRGQSGGVKKIKFKKDLLNFAKYWFGRRLITYQTDQYGQIVNNILIESSVDYLKEFYLGILIDRSINSIVFMVSTEGGVEIENLLIKKKNIMHKIIIDPLIGPQIYDCRKLAFKLGLSTPQINEFSKIFIKLILLFIECDLELLEINPLVLTKNGLFFCLDGKLSIDNNSLFRQSTLFNMYDKNQEDKREIYASQLGLNYVSLNGNIGCMVNGAGLAMSTMDMIKLYGGKPANFLDIGGGVTRDYVSKALKIILSDKKVKVVLVNIFGGIVKCDLVSDGIIDVLSKINISIPIVIRLEGNNSKLGINKLLNSGLNIINATDVSDAAKKAITYIKEV